MQLQVCVFLMGLALASDGDKHSIAFHGFVARADAIISLHLLSFLQRQTTVFSWRCSPKYESSSIVLATRVAFKVVGD